MEVRWRESVLRGVLTFGAFVAPPICVSSLFMRASRPGPLDTAVITGSGALIVLLRLLPGLTVSARALGLISLLFSTGVFMLARIGFVSGVAVLLAAVCVLGVVYLGRRLAFVLMGLTFLAYVLVGLAVSRGTIVVTAADLDPRYLRNWIRMVLTSTAVTAILATVVDSVIRHVEANARAANEALAHLRSLEAERQRVQELWQRGAEELIALGRGGAIESGDGTAAFQALCEAAARGLEVERVSVWLVDPDDSHIRCVNLFERTPRRHSSGLTIAAANAPVYFAALREARSLAVDDAQRDPLTRELREYLVAHGITSLLDAPIRYGDRWAGVICHEQVGPPRDWSPGSQSLAASFADFAARALAAADRAAQERDLRLAYERLGALHGRVEAAKEDERRFLAHELHDELGQTLTALKLRMQVQMRRRGAEAGAAENGAVAGGGPDALGLIDELIARVRKMSVDLRPPLLDEIGLVPALRAYLDGQAAISGVAIALDAGEGGERQTPDLEIAAFRVVQESITNVIRHAAARHVWVHLAWQPARILLSIRDDGRGFAREATLDAAAASGHLGVVGMRERVRAHGGAFGLASEPDRGTTVYVELPRRPRDS